jgi:predicted nuclease of restriction endonuclease-like (RecB) superfamily
MDRKQGSAATKTVSHPDYPAFLAEFKARILHARTNAARAVNRDLILLYWDIGRGIVQKQQRAGWGDAVVERLAADLRAEFPDMRGFSANNLWLVRQFYSEYSHYAFLEQLVQELKKTGGRLLDSASPSQPRNAPSND